MNNHMVKRYIIVVAVLVMVIITNFTVTSRAMTNKNKKAHTAYKEQLKKDRREFSNKKLPYAYRDIDNDKVDELIVYAGYGYCTEIIYDYVDDKIKQVCVIGQGEFTSYYKNKKVIYCAGSGHMGEYYTTYYKYKNGEYKAIAYVKTNTEDYIDGRTVFLDKPVNTYYINDKKVSKSKYKKYTKKLIKGDKEIEFSKIKWKK